MLPVMLLTAYYSHQVGGEGEQEEVNDFDAVSLSLSSFSLSLSHLAWYLLLSQLCSYHHHHCCIHDHESMPPSTLGRGTCSVMRCVEDEKYELIVALLSILPFNVECFVWKLVSTRLSAVTMMYIGRHSAY